MTICWECCESCLTKIFLFQVISEKKCFAKILLTSWELFLYQNNCSYHCGKFSCLFAFNPLKLIARIKSASWWSGNENIFCFWFMSSHTLLQSMANSIDFGKGDFLHVILVYIINSWNNMLLQNLHRKTRVECVQLHLWNCSFCALRLVCIMR